MSTTMFPMLPSDDHDGLPCSCFPGIDGKDAMKKKCCKKYKKGKKQCKRCPKEPQF